MSEDRFQKQGIGHERIGKDRRDFWILFSLFSKSFSIEVSGMKIGKIRFHGIATV